MRFFSQGMWEQLGDHLPYNDLGLNLASQARYAKHRRIAMERLAGIPGVTVPETSGAFYVFPRLEGVADSFDFCARMVREQKVGFAPGSAFGAGGEGHVRICFAVDEDTLREALDRFEAGWIAYRSIINA